MKRMVSFKSHEMIVVLVKFQVTKILFIRTLHLFKFSVWLPHDDSRNCA